MERTLKVLVVEDDPEDFLLIRRMVERARDSGLLAFSKPPILEHATTLADAKKKLDKCAFDMIYADLSLPDAKGTEVLLGLQSVAPGVPIVMITGDVSDNARERALVHNAKRVLTKTDITAPELADAIKHALSSPRTGHYFLPECQHEFTSIRQCIDDLRKTVVDNNKELFSKYDELLAALFKDNGKKSVMTVIKEFGFRMGRVEERTAVPADWPSTLRLMQTPPFRP